MSGAAVLRGRSLRAGGFLQRPEAPSLAFAVALCVIAAAAVPGFATADNLESTVAQVAVIGIVALALNQVILAGDIDVSVGSLLAACVIVAGLVGEHAGGLVLPLLASVGVGAAIGALNGTMTTRGRIPSIIATLGTLYVLRGVILAEAGDTVLNPPAASRALGAGHVLGIDAAVLVLLAAFVVFELLCRHSVWGRDLFAVGGNRQAARLAGLRIDWVRFRAFAALGATVGVAALVYLGQVGQVQATAGTGFELQAIAAVVVGGTSIAGGRGSNLAPLVGAVLIGVILNVLTLLSVPGTYSDLVVGALILLAISTDAVRRRLLARESR